MAECLRAITALLLICPEADRNFFPIAARLQVCSLRSGVDFVESSFSVIFNTVGGDTESHLVTSSGITTKFEVTAITSSNLSNSVKLPLRVLKFRVRTVEDNAFAHESAIHF
jgi:hypothetical protein